MMEKEKTCAIAAARAAGNIIGALYTTDSTVAYKGGMGNVSDLLSCPAYRQCRL